MSVAFAPHRQRGKGDITPAGIQKVIHLFFFLARRRMEAVVAGATSRWANQCSGAHPGRTVSRSGTILQSHSAVNMNISGV